MNLVQKNNWESIEQFSDSFPHLNAELIQTSKGGFNSSAETYFCEEFIIDRRETKAAHLHHSSVQTNTLSLIFPNNNLSNYISINNRDLSNNNQIMAFSNEEIFSRLPQNFSITTLSLKLDKLYEYIDENIIDFCPNNFRSQAVSLSNKFSLLSKLEGIFQNYKYEAITSNVVQRDIVNTIYQCTAEYLTDINQNQMSISYINKKTFETRLMAAMFELPLEGLNAGTLAKYTCVSIRSLYQYCK